MQLLTGQRLNETGGLTCGPPDRTTNELFHSGSPGGAARFVLTTEGLLVELHKVCEDVLRDGLLVRQTLEQNDNLRLSDSVHALRRYVPALPVNVC